MPAPKLVLLITVAPIGIPGPIISSPILKLLAIQDFTSSVVVATAGALTPFFIPKILTG